MPPTTPTPAPSITIEQALTKAIATPGGITLELSSERDAINLRLRMYKYRERERKAQIQAGDSSLTDFDDLVFYVQGPSLIIKDQDTIEGLLNMSKTKSGHET